MYRECWNISGELVCSLDEESIEKIEYVEKICSKTEFSVREIFNALDFDNDGVITKSDLEKLVSVKKGDIEYISKNDIKNLYSGMGKKICQGICNIINESQNQFISVDNLIDVLDNDNDGKIHFANFLKIAKKDGNLIFITSEEFEETFKDKWQDDIK